MLLRLRFKVINLFRSPQQGVVIFESFNGRTVSDSPLAIYEYLLGEKCYSHLSFVWVIDSPSNTILPFIESQPRTKIVFFKSKDYFINYRLASIWVTNCRLPKQLEKSRSQIFLQCWHGTPIKKLGCDIVTTSDISISKLARDYLYAKQTEDVDYFLSPSPYASERFISAFNLRPDQILESGYPRCDRLIELKEKKHSSAVKSMLGIPLDKKVVLYAPTYRDDVFAPKSSLSADSLSVQGILDSIQRCSDEIIVLYRGHYFSDQMASIDNVIDVSSHNDVNELLNITDLLVTDYSSIMFDFALLERAIICYLYDLDSYANESRGMYIEIDDTFPCVRVGSESELKEAILNAIDSNFAPSVNVSEFNRTYNPFEDGRSSMRVVEKMIKAARLK
ncbi:CDP-glycerol glycerophosphotransferase family protein [Vibrio sp. ZSDE26]|uniref:CDP-glycerol glycerophosphotransferase family protein n=1 Tax=Vibrio amylolyticus TaxID=2847292 RepID=A0A9X2BJ98_9VIBR|nr:CDP-glycerol glycerophosphotransferase family protein [Vibrio amylolyticus]MCK6263242.1 CDP-glycerol glycerophosphotransferase family protein [Vibrio amylolyticus]